MSAVTPDITINGTLVSPATIPQEEHESYFQLVWRRFRRSKVSIVGGLMVVGLVFLAAFANFFSPTDISKIDLKSSFIPPQQVRDFSPDPIRLQLYRHIGQIIQANLGRRHEQSV